MKFFPTHQISGEMSFAFCVFQSLLLLLLLNTICVKFYLFNCKSVETFFKVFLMINALGIVMLRFLLIIGKIDEQKCREKNHKNIRNEIHKMTR